MNLLSFHLHCRNKSEVYPVFHHSDAATAERIIVKNKRPASGVMNQSTVTHACTKQSNQAFRFRPNWSAEMVTGAALGHMWRQRLSLLPRWMQDSLSLRISSPCFEGSHNRAAIRGSAYVYFCESGKIQCLSCSASQSCRLIRGVSL